MYPNLTIYSYLIKIYKILLHFVLKEILFIHNIGSIFIEEWRTDQYFLHHVYYLIIVFINISKYNNI